MMEQRLEWLVDGKVLEIGMSVAGHGPRVLLLPSLSSVSTRGEMAGLMAELAPHFEVTAVDWPGFGTGAKPKLDWTPDRLSSFLAFVLHSVTPQPHAIVAAGHAASYVLHHLADNPDARQRLVSVAPTWRGPFPTMMKGQKPWFQRIRAAIDAPVIGPLLYGLNMSGPVVDAMLRRHVYAEPRALSPETLAQKRAVTRASGARYGSVRFVTGGLDRFDDHDSFMDAARALSVPHMVIYGEQTPPRSQAEMEALLHVPGVQGALFRRGRLSIHEEFASRVGQAALGFLL